MSNQPKIVVTHGRMGWANADTSPSSSLNAYGPGWRWEGTKGDLMSDHLHSEGMSEGAPMIVIASSSRFDSDLFDEMREPLSKFVTDWLSEHRLCKCGHRVANHDPGDGTCDVFSGDYKVGVCQCGRTS